MDLGLTGRVAIVAAASKGLRRAVAEELAREGARVGICARTASTLKEAAAHIQKTTGGEAFHRALDVTESGVVTTFVAAVDAHFYRIDVCVTNSGGPPSNLPRNPAGSVAHCRRPASDVDVHRLFWPGKLLRKCQRESGDI